MRWIGFGIPHAGTHAGTHAGAGALSTNKKKHPKLPIPLSLLVIVTVVPHPRKRTRVLNSYKEPERSPYKPPQKQCVFVCNKSSKTRDDTTRRDTECQKRDPRKEKFLRLPACEFCATNCNQVKSCFVLFVTNPTSSNCFAVPFFG